MSTNRKIVLTTGEVYHIFNRGVEKRPTFTDKRELTRVIETIKYYRFQNPPVRFSHFINLDKNIQQMMLKKLYSFPKHVEILAYCLMPNHFHFLLKQVNSDGISKFMANFSNSYTKYFNTKRDRVGPLFQGLFKAVHVDDDEQLLHISRYIHLNPVTAYLIESKMLEQYTWSSYPAYMSIDNQIFIDKEFILRFFNNQSEYKNFVLNQVDYARTLQAIKHLIFE